jgi:hypothetical protein
MHPTRMKSARGGTRGARRLPKPAETLAIHCIATITLTLACTVTAQDGAWPKLLPYAGDYYTLTDGSTVALYRASDQIAVKRHPALPMETVLELTRSSRIPVEERVLATLETEDSMVLDILRVDDAAQALAGISRLEETIQCAPVYADAVFGRRLAVTDQIVVQLSSTADLDLTLRIFDELGLVLVEEPKPASPGQYLLARHRHRRHLRVGRLRPQQRLADAVRWHVRGGPLCGWCWCPGVISRPPSDAAGGDERDCVHLRPNRIRRVRQWQSSALWTRKSQRA